MSTVERPSGADPAPAARLGGGLTARMLLASGLLMLVLAATFAVLLAAVAELRATARAAHASEEVLATANELERLVVDLETGVRGFVLTREQQFLEPYDAARASLPARAAELERLSAGTRNRRARPGGSTGRRARMSSCTRSPSWKRPGGPSLPPAASPRPRRASGGWTPFGSTSTPSSQPSVAWPRLRRGGRTRRRAARWVAAVGGLVVALVLVLILAGYLTRAIVRPVLQAAQMAVRLAGGNLGTRMPATGVAEIGQLERAFNEMAGSLEQNRDDLADLATEQAALRRVATLVARRVSPDELFGRVAEEMGALLGADITTMVRFGPVGRAELVVAAGAEADAIPAATTWDLEEPWATTLVWQTGRSARVDDYQEGSGQGAELLRRVGIRSSVASPILVEERLWGAMVVSSRAEPLPSGTEGRMADFTELVAMAIASAEARGQLRRWRRSRRRCGGSRPWSPSRSRFPSAVFEAVTREVGLLCDADLARMERYEPDGTVTGVAAWSRVPSSWPWAPGSAWMG